MDRSQERSLKNHHIGVMKAVLWEEAKGKLRAIVAAAGSKDDHMPYSEKDSRMEFEVISEEVENFISGFEREEFNL